MSLRIKLLAPLFPLALLLVSLAFATLAAAGPCPSPNAGGC
jgi:hypothetical protein